jgi:hypothetical protein
VLAAVPQWGRVERVRSTDWSFMGNHHAYGSFALFHQRHFAHVPAFLHAIYPGCQARLVELNRPLIPDVRIGLAGGYSYFGDTHGGYLSGGVDVGLPFTRLREWEALIGVHASLLSQANGDRRLALLAGLRAGLEYTHQPSAGGFRIGGFGEIGGGGVSMAPRPGADQEWAPTAYLEAGGYLGYRSGGGNALSIAAEFAGGSTIVPVPAAVAPGLDLRDDENLTWFRAGVRAAVEF